jgi:colanic acid/amylovoran biosynthesis glycosyltransferase
MRRLWRAPLVVTFHGYDFTRWPRQHGRDVYLPLFGEVDAVLVGSDYARARLVDLGCPEHLLHRVNVGIDLDAFPNPARTPVNSGPVRLLSVGRLTDKKGHDTTIRALARVLARTRTPLVLDVVGTGPCRPELERMVSELRLEEVVRFHGTQPADRVKELLAAADIFVLASRTAADGDQEGTPVALMEAQASGLPVVSTRHSGIPEIVVDGETGYLVEENNAEQVADCLVRLIDDEHDRARLGEKGREHIRAHHSLRSTTRAVLDIYESLADPVRIGA